MVDVGQLPQAIVLEKRSFSKFDFYGTCGGCGSGIKKILRFSLRGEGYLGTTRTTI